ncbi:hypothetical protein WBJ53_03135 [Spirosoma sp. SC4-14]|uniref:hypothetical protein n=1 Tax=Spirosoma sp. SC4-14 TaxID=3128900 RepID=UPI0030CC9818
MITSKPFSHQFRRFSLSVGILLAFACGPGLFDENEFLSFFLPESARIRAEDKRYIFSPLLYSSEGNGQESPDSLSADVNLKAWVAYAGGGVSTEVAAKVIYEGDKSAENAFIAQLSRMHEPALAYIQLARKVERASGGGDIWSPVPADTAALKKLLVEAQTGYAAAPDAFLKERYAYQAVKLADQTGDYANALSLYDKLVVPLATKTYISDWALCRHAGAALSEGDTARAIYEFAQVFDRCPSRREQAEASLRIYGLRFRDSALTFAHTDQEKAAVYALCAIQPKQDALPLLESLVALAPQNPLVELTMAREINRNEYYFLSDQNPIYGYDEASRHDSVAFETRRKTSASYADQLRDFALGAATNEKLNDPAFWYTAAAYLAYLSKDYADAQATLDKAAMATTSNVDLKKQIALQRMLLLAAQTETITAKTESQLIGYLEEFGNTENFRFNNAFVTVCGQFADLYRKEANDAKSEGWFSSCSRPKTDVGKEASMAKSFLLTMLTSSQLNRSGAYVNINTDQLAIEDSTSASTVKQVVAFAQQTNPTDFDKRLLKLTGFDLSYLHTLLGRRWLAEQRYQEAAEAFAKVPDTVWHNEPFTTYFTQNPFRLPPIGEATASANPYTPVQFAQRMAQLQKQLQDAKGEDAAKLYYELGCGAYNISWFGNAWLLVKRSWSSAELVGSLYGTTKPGELDRAGRQLMHDPYYSTAPAKAFFEQAMKATKKPELAARACFMAARCEQNELTIRLAVEEVKRGYADYDEKKWETMTRKLRREQYGHFLAQLASTYRQTRFQHEMLRECATYADYVGGR